MIPSILSGKYFESQDTLDLEEILRLFSLNFKFKENHQFIRKAPLSSSPEFITKSYQQQSALEDQENWEEVFSKTLGAIDHDFPFNLVLKKTSKFQVLEPIEILQTYEVLKASTPLFKKIKIPFAHELDTQQSDKTFREFYRGVELLFDFKGRDIIYYRHPLLAPTYKKIQELSKELRTRLAKVSSQWGSEDILSGGNYDLLDDRYVLPVRSDRYNSSLGRIIYRSNTGNTLYIEPHSLRLLTNEKEELSAKLERVLFQILQDLCRTLGEAHALLKSIFENILLFDKTAGAVRCSHKYQLVHPQFNKKGFDLDIKSLFHPLIEDPVKNNITTTPDSSGVLISGPNTGGKTVLLKSLCLCLVLPHLGLGVPASEAQLPYVSSLYFMSHDNQDIKEGLSSFSSEALNYLHVLQEIQSGSFIFIDEIFNTTSSVEASQLAASLIKQLKEKGAFTYISSHHEYLKETVFKEGLLVSGHMGFKKDSSEPTYVFHQGSPGQSYAKEIFRRLENNIFKAPVVTRWLGTENIQDEDLALKVRNLDEMESHNRVLIEKNQKLKQDLEQEKKNIQNLLKIERQKLEQEFEAKWTKIKKDTLDIAEKIKRGEVKNTRKVVDKLSQIKKNSPDLTDYPTADLQKVDEKDLQEGSRVFIPSLGKVGTIIKLPSGQKKAHIDCKGIKVWVPKNNLYWPSGSNEKRSTPQVSITVDKYKSERNMVLDARGMRREPFLKAAEEHLFDLLNGDLPFIDVIHGHGTGVLKTALYELLKRFSDDIKYGHVEGNMGTTRIELLD